MAQFSGQLAQATSRPVRRNTAGAISEALLAASITSTMDALALIKEVRLIKDAVMSMIMQHIKQKMERPCCLLYDLISLPLYSRDIFNVICEYNGYSIETAESRQLYFDGCIRMNHDSSQASLERLWCRS